MTKPRRRRDGGRAHERTREVLPGQLAPRPDLYVGTNVEPFVQVKRSQWGESAESAIDVTPPSNVPARRKR